DGASHGHDGGRDRGAGGYVRVRARGHGGCEGGQGRGRARACGNAVRYREGWKEGSPGGRDARDRASEASGLEGSSAGGNELAAVMYSVWGARTARTARSVAGYALVRRRSRPLLSAIVPPRCGLSPGRLSSFSL